MDIFEARFPSRRAVALGALGALPATTLAREGVAQPLTDISRLKPGDFTWHPERQSTGPVAVVVSLPQQLVHVYRNGVRIAVSTCSTGRQGHATPTGVFVVLEKDRHHRSSTYSGAPMPNMNRLTWSGIALHAGNLPGYPASHGCVRLPLDFSARLFDVTHLGTPVIIAGAHSDPYEITHPGMVLGGYAEHEFKQVEATLAAKKHPSDWSDADSHPVTSLIGSSADNRIMLIENGEVLAEGLLTIAGSGPLGGHVFVFRSAPGGGMQWQGIGHSEQTNAAFSTDGDALRRISADRAFVDKLAAKTHPGMIMILTDAPLHPDSRSGRDFVIMS